MAGSKGVTKRKQEAAGGGEEASGAKKQTLEMAAATHAKEHDELARALLDGSALELVAEDDPTKRCLTRTALPQGVDPASIPKLRTQWPPNGLKVAAKEYPFKLDPFQSAACNSLERRESVLVAAHTSAGKTVVAEYAIAMALRDKQRVVYTSPLKALSNQKYRELFEKFQDVGLMTGDVVINPHASCLVMTTEVLRSMLYRGSEVVREVAWLVYDEVHYLRDKQRGVVWEESIVMAPKGCRFAFLSATLPNAFEFAGWVARLHGQPCNVVYTDFRPTPLQHYVFPHGGDDLHQVVNDKGVFLDKNFQKAIQTLSKPAATTNASKKDDKSAKGKGKGGSNEEQSDIYKVVSMCMDKNLDPVIVFDFSKRNCEALSEQMSSLDLTTDEEKALIDGVFNNAIDVLCDDDKRLPQISGLLPKLKRGIGMHHSGLLPIMKEVIEILFQEGLIRVLFATETFSTGLNMPAKTVIFTSVRKFDDCAFRWLSGGEYIQMSGRAGRRGLDDKGIVILMLDDRIEPAIAKGIVRGKADCLYSAFHLGFSMVLNLFRLEAITPERLIQGSFRQFQVDSSLPKLNHRVDQLKENLDQMVIEDEAEVEEYANLKAQLRLLHVERRTFVNDANVLVPFLQAGRLIRTVCLAPQLALMEDESGAGIPGAFKEHEMAALAADPLLSGLDEELAWGVVLNFDHLKKDGPKTGAENTVLVDVLINCAVDSGDTGRKGKSHPMPHTKEGGEARVVTLPIDRIDCLSKLRINLSKDLKSADNRQAGMRLVGEVFRRFKGEIPVLEPEQELKVDKSMYRKVTRRVETVEDLISKHSVTTAPNLPERLQMLQNKHILSATLKGAKKAVSAAGAMVLGDDLKKRRRVLRQLGYVDSDMVVQAKGHVACEISTSDEIVTTELIFSGILKTLTVEQAVALLSCLVWTEKSTVKVKVRDDLQGPLRALTEMARKVGTTMQECKMDIDVNEYVDTFQTSLIDMTYAWCRGAKFAEIMKLVPDIFEGSLVRVMRRLEELLRQIAGAAKSIGDDELEAKMVAGQEKLKRDIVFAASLYL